MPALRVLRMQERWETNIKTTFAQQELAMKKFHRFKKIGADVIGRYEKWLKRNEMISVLNLDYYKDKLI